MPTTQSLPFLAVPSAKLAVQLRCRRGAEALGGERQGKGSTIFFHFNPFFLIDYCSHLQGKINQP